MYPPKVGFISLFLARLRSTINVVGRDKCRGRSNERFVSCVAGYGSLEAALRADGDVYRLLRAIFPVLASDETSTEEPAVRGTAPGAARVAAPLGEAVMYKALAHNDRFPRTHLVMSPSQLIDEGYPLPLKGALKNK